MVVEVRGNEEAMFVRPQPLRQAAEEKVVDWAALSALASFGSVGLNLSGFESRSDRRNPNPRPTIAAASPLPTSLPYFFASCFFSFFVSPRKI